MDIGDKIRLLREQKGLTLEQLGNMVGVGKSTVRKWETGQIANMRRDKIKRLADALGVSPLDILSSSSSPSLQEDLAFDERQLVEDYRGLTPPGKEYIRQTMAMAKQTYSEKNVSVSDMETAE